jgi:hypothetical protein
MQRIDVIVNRESVARYVCNRSHPHPTQAGAEACEAARAEGATDAELLVLMEAEVAEFNAA